MTAKRKGISFTMTLAVTGLLLLVTAVVVASFGTTGITQFFKDITGTQKGKVDTYQVKQACKDLAEQINEQYCDEYMPNKEYPDTATDEGSNGIDCGTGGGGPDHSGRFCDCSTNSCPTYSSSAWEQKSSPCASSTGATEPDRLLGTLDRANNSEEAFTKTGDQLECDWTQVSDDLFGFEGAPTVEVNGNTYNCLKRNHFSPTCPPMG